MKLAIFFALIFVATTSFAAQKYCGWLSNPTPANISLYDSSGEITISTQGEPQPEGIENLPNVIQNEYVRTNVNYGYSCVCLPLEIDQKTKKVKTILPGGKQKLLKTCLEDRRIKFPELSGLNN